MNKKTKTDERTKYQASKQPSLETRFIINHHNGDYQKNALKFTNAIELDPKIKKSLWQHFSNLSISRKQLIAFICAEFLSILGLGLVSRILLRSNLQTLSIEQAKSELAVTEIAYNIKVNQMGFGFRGQSDNTAIIKAVTNYSSGQAISDNLKTEVRQILQNEIKARKIEYATLVGKDFRIIVNANNNRQGEIFNPDGLIKEVFQYPRQIKTNKIVKWSELSKEAPPLPEGFQNQDALIRYTITPVRNPNNQEVIGALVSGDIVNGKTPIVKDTLKGTGGGYSAVYFRQPTGGFTLAKSLEKLRYQDISQVKTNVVLPQEAIPLLTTAASSNEGAAVTARIKLDNQFYTIAAKAIPNKIIEADEGQIPIFGEQAIAILVRGTPETALNKLLEKSFWIELLTVVIALILILIWTIIMKRAIIKPIELLQEKSQKFANGERNARAEIFSTDEIGKLAFTFNEMADKLTQQAIQQENEAKAAQIVNEITSGCRGTLNTTYILNVVATSTRDAIKADRVVVYCFNEDWTGKVIAESVSADFPIAFGTEIADTCSTKEHLDKYQRGFVLKLDNIYEDILSKSAITELEKLAVKASLVAPILLNNKLYGFLIAHQCLAAREWQALEINLLKQLTIPVGYALEQESLLKHVEQVSSFADQIVTEQHQQNEALQEQIIKLLHQIEGALRGDLTVRAQVNAEEFSTIVDFLNAIVESFRAVVTKVKVSANQVNAAIVNSEGLINPLTETVTKLTKEINRTLIDMEHMTLSIQQAAENAQKVALVAQTASHTAAKTELTIEQNRQNILGLRSTIHNIAKKVKLFGESSQQTSQIMTLINQIAMRSQVLAINSGLEAARYSDEENEGIAVIATEVNELAALCTEASQKTETIVNNMQQEVSEVVKAMEEGTIQIVEDIRVVEQAKIPLNQIIGLSDEINQLVQSISQASISGVKTSQVATESMKEISQLSKLTSDSSHQISQSLQQTVEIYQQLQGTVEKFKIS
jgi:twitching motility protein PilJ